MVRPRGISLIECIIAIVILAIVITSAIFALSTARFQVTTARHHYQAINIARDRIEDIISGGSAAAGVTPVVIDPSTGLGGNLTVSYPVAGRIDITVDWDETLFSDTNFTETIVMLMP
ncbi:MAG: prepilin-type N-terminal cleavage/methylation domain-containing protein [Candidatus Omnitrophota bacterium]